MSGTDPAVVIDENVQRLRTVLEQLAAKKLEARGFTDPRAGLRYLRDSGTALLFVSATTREVTPDLIARAARLARGEEPLRIVLCGADRTEDGPFDDAARTPEEIVAACASFAGIQAPGEEPPAATRDEREEEEEAPAAPPRPREPAEVLREIPFAQRYVPKPVAAPAPPPPSPAEPSPGPHVLRPTPLADMLARYRVR